VDLVLTDPPYAFDRGNRYFREWFPILPDHEWPRVLAELHRVLRADRHAYVICDRRTQPVFQTAATGAGFRLDRLLIWNKAVPGLGGGVYRAQHELILFLQKGRRAGNHHRLGDVLTHPIVRGKHAYPTEKPAGLLQDLIGQSTTVGETVLDPFCVSGSTGHAAHDLGRRALLADINPGVAERRLGVTPVPIESGLAVAA
jgi:site-specific DNA-methyltransferase (adenine-specific)